MKEIGGYIEFEHYHGEMLHDDAIKLNSGRSCLAYLIVAKKIKKIAIPYFLCDCIEDTCKKHNVQIRYYHIGYDFLPVEVSLEDGEWLYLVNYYGQLSRETIKEYKGKYDRVILDNAHAYFEDPIPGIDTLYTCRKYFGVPDGGILYTDCAINVEEIDISYNRYYFLEGRYEKNGSDFFSDYLRNEDEFFNKPIMSMSKLTENILHSLDYQRILCKRIENYNYLENKFCDLNRLKLVGHGNTFMYPLMIDHAVEIRKKLINGKIYIPQLWPNVKDLVSENSIEYELTFGVLPIPIDQRYGIKEMDIMIDAIKSTIQQ